MDLKSIHVIVKLLAPPSDSQLVRQRSCCVMLSMWDAPRKVVLCNVKYVVYFPFQPVVHNWFIKGRGMYCSVYGKVHIKDPLLLIEKSSLCGGSGFPSKKCVNVTI